MPSWENARQEVLQGLQRVQRLVDARDEQGILEIINQQDAFCQAAHDVQAAAGSARQDEPQCQFCQAFTEAGGCGDLIKRINHAVMNGQWDEARVATDDYIAWIRKLEGVI